MSTPTSLELPAGTARTTVTCDRGTFAGLEALPPGPSELGTALLIPGYTGSKEDFIPILGRLAAAGRRVVAVDMRGQYQTPGPDDPAAYDLAQLGADVAALATATGAAHLLGHSFGGLVAREAVLGGRYGPASLTLMSSGPAALPGARAGELRSFLDFLDGTPRADLGRKIAEIWHGMLRPQAVATGVTEPVVAFLAERTLANNPTGMVTMAGILLAAKDRTSELADQAIPKLVLYGADDNAWPTAHQRAMAARLNAEHACIPAAAHSPSVEAPAATARALTQFWDKSEKRA